MSTVRSNTKAPQEVNEILMPAEHVCKQGTIPGSIRQGCDLAVAVPTEKIRQELRTWTCLDLRRQNWPSAEKTHFRALCFFFPRWGSGWWGGGGHGGGCLGAQVVRV